eukprot:TRINITY_DN18401_c1_g1_i3.p2 TRINITY_DN18401_c1_g1~~TRINITY_DN18401_c1_g1_i3.p2  ORF type:complete len:100 (-),score=16.02 TRINITY_DN18401_c1_g1_i3:325-624(-)
MSAIAIEPLPSFCKVVVLPDKDVCYGVACLRNAEKQGEDESQEVENCKNEALMGIFVRQIDMSGEDDSAIHFYKTESIDLESIPDNITDHEQNTTNSKV